MNDARVPGSAADLKFLHRNFASGTSNRKAALQL
jgi:hypothetical protein